MAQTGEQSIIVPMEPFAEQAREAWRENKPFIINGQLQRVTKVCDRDHASVEIFYEPWPKDRIAYAAIRIKADKPVPCYACDQTEGHDERCPVGIAESMISGFAVGGFVQPGLFNGLVGERGPEPIMPIKRALTEEEGAGESVSVTINFPTRWPCGDVNIVDLKTPSIISRMMSARRARARKAKALTPETEGVHRAISAMQNLSANRKANDL